MHNYRGVITDRQKKQKNCMPLGLHCTLGAILYPILPNEICVCYYSLPIENFMLLSLLIKLHIFICSLQKRCDINRANRNKLKINHFMGSKAFVPARAELVSYTIFVLFTNNILVLLHINILFYRLKMEQSLIELSSTRVLITRLKKDGHLQRLRQTM